MEKKRHKPSHKSKTSSSYNDNYLYICHYTHISSVVYFPKGKTNKQTIKFSDIVFISLCLLYCISFIKHTVIYLLTIAVICKTPGYL